MRFAAVERKVGCLGTHPPNQHGEQLGVFVIRMGTNHQDTFVVAQHAELLVQRNSPAAGGWLELRPQALRKEEKQDEERGTSGEQLPMHKPGRRR